LSAQDGWSAFDAMSPVIQIDRLSIRVPGVERGLGRRLGQLVAERLASSLQLGPGEASFDRLHVELAADGAESPEALAGRIAAQVALLIGDPGALEAGR
jgi:hypothetical protein